MANNDGEMIGQKDVLAILTEDVQSHRDYIQRLYRNALYIGGGVLLGGFALGAWIIGKEFDATIFRYQLNNELDAIVSVIAEGRLREAQDVFEETNTLIENAETKISAATDSALQNAVDRLEIYTSENVAGEVEQLLETRLSELDEADLAQVVSQITFPIGMVAAFDRASGCPEGWTRFNAGAGRMIVGVDGDEYDLPYIAGEPRYHIGGAAFHTLTVAELPSHSHQFSGETVARGGWGGSIVNPVAGGGSQVATNGGYTPEGSISVSGQSRPHNNMPPYIALHLCKKN